MKQGAVLSVVAGLLLTGCYGFTPIKGQSPEEVKAAMAPAPDHATVVIMPNADTGDLLDEAKHCLALSPRASEYYIASLPPGRHEIHAIRIPDGKAIAVDLAPGKTYVLTTKGDWNSKNLELVQMKPSSVEWNELDWNLTQRRPMAVVQEKCPEFISKYYYDDRLDKLMAAMHQSIANNAPLMGPADGVTYNGSFKDAK